MSGVRVADRTRWSRDALAASIGGLACGGWDPSFQGDVIDVARFIVGRIAALVNARIDCVVSFDRVSIDGISVTNPLRVSVTPDGGYPQLRERLRSDPTYDSVPLALGRSSRGIALWDGHRRMETYRAAGRVDVPALVATFRRGSGLVLVG